MINAARNVGRFGRFIRNEFTEKSVNGRALSNLYTGRDLNMTGTALAGVGIIGYMGYKASEGSDQYYYDAAMDRGGGPDAVQSLPGTRADGLAYNASPYNGPQLEASGDLVFALHKIRHGG